MSASDKEFVSLAIETTCRVGAVALGVGDKLVEKIDFDASRRAAAQVIGFMDELVKRHSFAPSDVDAVIVSQGPGSFTGTRVGVTVGRTFSQAVENCKSVGVHTPAVVAENISGSAGKKCCVILDARAGKLYISPFTHDGSHWQADCGSYVLDAAEFDRGLNSPVTLTGEGLGYCTIENPHAEFADKDLWLPRVENLWQLGYEMAQKGEYEDYHQLLPIYTGKSQAEQNWEKNNSV